MRQAAGPATYTHWLKPCGVKLNWAWNLSRSKCNQSQTTKLWFRLLLLCEKNILEIFISNCCRYRELPHCGEVEDLGATSERENYTTSIDNALYNRHAKIMIEVHTCRVSYQYYIWHNNFIVCLPQEPVWVFEGARTGLVVEANHLKMMRKELSLSLFILFTTAMT